MAVAKRSRQRACASIGALVWLALVSCSGAVPPSAPQRERGASGAQTGSERGRRPSARPRSLTAAMDLVEQYYTEARQALDQGRQADYLALLGKAQAEALAAARNYPTAEAPHTWMGIITTYEGDLDAAANCFRNALRLAERESPRDVGGALYSNIAHISVYQGQLETARRYLQLAMRTGAPEDEIARISILAAWKAGDMVEARDLFEDAVVTSRDFAESWDQAKLPAAMEQFRDFASVCCRNPTCGPYMTNACEREQQAVKQRELTLESLRKEMELERERRRALQEIYKGRKDVTITLDDPDAPSKPGIDPKPGSGSDSATPSIPRPNPRR